MIDLTPTSRELIAALTAERIVVPVVACGVERRRRRRRARDPRRRARIPPPAAGPRPDRRRCWKPSPTISHAARRARPGDDHGGAPRRAGRGHRSLACSSPASPAPARRCWRATSTAVRAARNGAVRRASTAPPSPRICWKANCSATRRAPSPARSPGASASSRRPTAARCCSTKSARWTCGCRRSCLRALQEREIDRLGGSGPVKSTSASSPPPTATCAAEVARRQLPRGPLFPPQRRRPALPPLRERPGDIAALWPSISPAATPR